MKIHEHIDQLKQKYQVLDVVPLSLEEHSSYSNMKTWLEQTCQSLHRAAYEPNQRLIFTLEQDTYVKREKLGLMLRSLQVTCAEVGINNFFIIVVSTNPNVQQELDLAQNFSTDIHAITGLVADDSDWQPKIVSRYPSDVKEDYKYGAINPIKISLGDLSNKEKDLLTTNKTFCMYPWIHINANPDGQAYPCCMTDHKFSIGNVKQQSLAEIWNNDHMRDVRRKMLTGQEIAGCERCYEQEKAGFFSGRLGANRHHGHHVGRILETKPDGTLDRFEMVYWDIRFSNLCNLRCRSCGHIYSSQWYQDQAKLAGPEWAKNNKVLNIAGQHDNDMWEQLLPHIDYVEQIYFAGGEPLLMHEHYRILEELVRREMFNVRLIYNTNFTHTHLKDRSVFEYWKLFENVSVGASLDGAEHYAEVIRKGSDWDQIERNRVEMLQICPQVDFYVSATLSIMNALHLTEFHRNWVERGYIRHQDFNINILQDPNHYRIDIAPPAYKQLLKNQFEQQIAWLEPHDKLRRATQGYQSAINFMMATDNQHLIPKFWQMTKQLDTIRNENLVDLIPELENLNADTTR